MAGLHECVSDIELSLGVIHSGKPFTPDFEQLRDAVDEFAPVRATFIVIEASGGFAPQQVREDSVGAELPVRARSLTSQIAVLAREAIYEFDRQDKKYAAAWWRSLYAQATSPLNEERHVNFVLNVNTVEFNPDCGILEPVHE